MSDLQKKKRHTLLKIIANIRYLDRQGLPLRGCAGDENSNVRQLNLLSSGGDAEFTKSGLRKGETCSKILVTASYRMRAKFYMER